MGFALSIGCGIDGPNDIVIELLDSYLIHCWKTFYDVGADALNILFLKRIYVLDERLGRLSRCEKWCHWVVYGEVCQMFAQDLIREVDHGQWVVDEQVTPHQLVHEELFDQSEGRIVVEDTLLLVGYFRFLDLGRMLLKFVMVMG